MKKRPDILLFLSFLLFLFMPFLHHAQTISNGPPDSICVSKEEMHLYNLINNLRLDAGKQEIPLSYALSKVAKFHTWDLETNHPDTSLCNYHSWSDKGRWSACCYNSQAINSDCIRNKPKELTDYHYTAYELITWDSRQAHPDSVFNLWNSFSVSKNMFLNDGEWKKLNWKAIGISISEHYVSIWFGNNTDSKKQPGPCETLGDILPEDSLKTAPAEVSSPFIRSTGEYHIIYGSYTKAEDAMAAKKKLSAQFPGAGIVKGETNFRISLDRFDSLQEARKAKETYDSTFQSGWILKY